VKDAQRPYLRDITPERQALAERMAAHIGQMKCSINDPVEWLLTSGTVGSMMFHFLADEIDAARVQGADMPPVPAPVPVAVPSRPPTKAPSHAAQDDLFG
jgi:hypothetical protein